MSAPASAWLAAVCASSLSVGSFRIFSGAPAPPGVIFPPGRSRRPHAAMAVAHVFAQAHVRDDEQRRQFLFQQPHRLLHDAVLGVSAARLLIFFIGNAEEQNRRHAERVRRRRLAHNFIRRQLKHAGHGNRWDGGPSARCGRTTAARATKHSTTFPRRAGAARAKSATGAGEQSGNPGKFMGVSLVFAKRGQKRVSAGDFHWMFEVKHV